MVVPRFLAINLAPSRSWILYAYTHIMIMLWGNARKVHNPVDQNFLPSGVILFQKIPLVNLQWTIQKRNPLLAKIVHLFGELWI